MVAVEAAGLELGPAVPLLVLFTVFLAFNGAAELHFG